MGKPIGIGRKIYPDGKFKMGYWDKGKFVEGCKKFVTYLLIYRGT